MPEPRIVVDATVVDRKGVDSSFELVATVRREGEEVQIDLHAGLIIDAGDGAILAFNRDALIAALCKAGAL